LTSTESAIWRDASTYGATQCSPRVADRIMGADGH
jgi:hypothetical protein